MASAKEIEVLARQLKISVKEAEQLTADLEGDPGKVDNVRVSGPSWNYVLKRFEVQVSLRYNGEPFVGLTKTPRTLTSSEKDFLVECTVQAAKKTWRTRFTKPLAEMQGVPSKQRETIHV